MKKKTIIKKLIGRTVLALTLAASLVPIPNFSVEAMENTEILQETSMNMEVMQEEFVNSEIETAEVTNVEIENVEIMNAEAENIEAVNVETTNIEGENIEVTNAEAENVETTSTEVENVESANSEAENMETITVETATETYESNLPVIYIDTEGGAAIVSKEDYIDATMRIQGNEEFSEADVLYDGKIEIRGRGNTTWKKPKKPYRIKLDKKANLCGMGSSKHWVLLANYMDRSLMRNTLAYDLSGSMGMTHTSTVWVDVVLNGEYIGNYQLCENIRVDKNRVDIFDWESFAEDSAEIIAEAEGFDKDAAGDLEDYMLETDMSWITSGVVAFHGNTYKIEDYPSIEVPSITGGYLLELDSYYDEVSKFKTKSGQPIMFKNPEFVNTNKDMMNYVSTYVQAFEDAVQSEDYSAMYQGESTHYSELYDVDSLVDYWLVCEIFFQEEMNKKSTYMYKDIDEPIHMGPIWDMDWSSAGEGDTDHTDKWATTYFSDRAQRYNWYKYLVQDPYFLVKVQERYWEIREKQVQDMVDSVPVNYEYLKESAAADGKAWGYSKDFKTYVDVLHTWLKEHLIWMDEQMQSMDKLLYGFSYNATAGLDLTMADKKGNALEADLTEDAPSDGLVFENSDVLLKVKGSNGVAGTAKIYVNSIELEEQLTVGTTEISATIPGAALTAEASERNVIEVKVYAANGKVLAANFVTVREKVCGHTNQEVVGKVGATCTTEGYTGDITCTTCLAVIEKGTVVEASGHTEVAVTGKPATCLEAGLTDGVKCSVCEKIVEEQVVISAPGHTEVIIAGKSATCLETGLADGLKCSVCEEILEEQAVLPAKGHTEVTVAGKTATCLEMGLTDGLKCSVCGEILVKQENIPALTHKYGEWKVVKEATEEEAGLKERVCEYGCGAREEEVLPQIDTTVPDDGEKPEPGDNPGDSENSEDGANSGDSGKPGDGANSGDNGKPGDEANSEDNDKPENEIPPEVGDKPEEDKHSETVDTPAEYAQKLAPATGDIVNLLLCLTFGMAAIIFIMKKKLNSK